MLFCAREHGFCMLFLLFVDIIYRNIWLMSNRRIGLWWRVMWKYVTPSLTLVCHRRYTGTSSHQVVFKLSHMMFPFRLFQFVIVYFCMYRVDVKYNGCLVPYVSQLCGWMAVCAILLPIPIMFIYTWLHLDAPFLQVSNSVLDIIQLPRHKQKQNMNESVHPNALVKTQ